MAKILVVESDKIVRELIGRYLEKMGHTADLYYDPITALKDFAEGKIEKPDLAMTNLITPEITAVEFCKQVRQLLPQIPVIICSGDPEYYQDPRPFNESIAKPFMFWVFGTKIKSTLFLKRRLSAVEWIGVFLEANKVFPYTKCQKDLETLMRVFIQDGYDPVDIFSAFKWYGVNIKIRINSKETILKFPDLKAAYNFR